MNENPEPLLPGGQAKATQEENGLRRWFDWRQVSKHLNFDRNLAIILFVIGTLLTLYLFYAGIEEPGLTYYVKPERATGPNNSHIVEVQIWNRGKAPIKGKDLENGGDVVRQLTINLVDAKPVAVTNSLRILGTNDPSEELTVATSPVYQSIGTNHFVYSYALRWKVLQDQVGFKLQLTYLGNTSAPVHVDASLLRQKEIEQYSKIPNELVILSLVMVGILFLGLFFIKRHSYPKWKLGIFLGVGVFCGAAILTLTVLYWNGCYSNPSVYFDNIWSTQLTEAANATEVVKNGQFTAFLISFGATLVALLVLLLQTSHRVTEKTMWIISLRIQKILPVVLIFVVGIEALAWLAHIYWITPMLIKLVPPFGM